MISYLLVNVQLAENLGRVKQMRVLVYPVMVQHGIFCRRLYCSLEPIPGCQRQVQDQRDPVAVHEE